MKNLEIFLREHPAAPIAPPDRLDMLLRIVKATVQSGVSSMRVRPESYAHSKEKEGRNRRLNALCRAIDGLTEGDRRLLSIGLSLEAAEDDILIHDSLTHGADEVLAQLKNAAQWCTEGQDRRRYDAQLRKQFVEAAARLYVGYGFTEISENYSANDPKQRAVFQEFIHALLRDCDIPAPDRTEHEHEPFRVMEYPVDHIGKTPEERAAWVQNIASRIA